MFSKAWPGNTLATISWCAHIFFGKISNECRQPFLRHAIAFGKTLTFTATILVGVFNDYAARWPPQGNVAPACDFELVVEEVRRTNLINGHTKRQIIANS